ncbi:MAG: glutamate synthase domain-containing protein 2/glutamate synthase domain-containing protein 1 [Cellvibrionaceae bacterium]|jgi:glutamate synthase domain-containing protein 2/glutamate synthase domain-containing protein 1/glutamate synthase domain-containing protein 3
MLEPRHKEEKGLYRSSYEHDACGMGFVVHIKGQQSHEIVQQALQVLENMEHRGATGAEANSGDGAGLLIQIPHHFLKHEFAQQGVELPAVGDYGVGMVFMPKNATQRQQCRQQFEAIVKKEEQTVLGWRVLPVDNSDLGNTAKNAEPVIEQVIIRKDSLPRQDALAFERKLFVIRRLAEIEIRDNMPGKGADFYIPSLSCRKVIYKGMFLSTQVRSYFKDLSNPLLASAIAVVHSRFSTNTFPSWDRAHPYRYLIHNGEINTIKGNANWMNTRKGTMSAGDESASQFGDDIERILPLIDPDTSDSGQYDNALEFLYLSGYSLPHAVMMTVPEPWQKHKNMNPEKRAFYEYHSCMMEPWDGPASIGFTDGVVVGAVLDRNGLRPSRYYVTKDDIIVLASEVGVMDVHPEDVIEKGRLRPGRMLLVDTEQGRIISDEEIKSSLANAKPYQKWLDENLTFLKDLEDVEPIRPLNPADVLQRQQFFGYTFEDLRTIIAPMAATGLENLGSMGDDTPPAVLSEHAQPLFNYFKQLFAQVTNPPIDAIREELVTDTTVFTGKEPNILDPRPENAKLLKLPHPLLTNEDLAKIRHMKKDGFKVVTLSLLYDVRGGGTTLKDVLDELFEDGEEAVRNGATILILSDRRVDAKLAAIPSLLAASGLHHHLVQAGLRGQTSIILESGDPREVHHYAVLIGYGVSAINPYLALESINQMIETGILADISYEEAAAKYIKGIVKGIVKVLSKMGISTIQSYHGAQIFEALGLANSVVDKYFCGTDSRIGGIDLFGIAQEVEARHHAAYPERPANGHQLSSGGRYQWRHDGEFHLFNPTTVHALQDAVRNGSYSKFKRYTNDVNNHKTKMATLRGALQVKPDTKPIPLSEVESVKEICRRFKTGAMSYGSISAEAHEALAIAMNQIGGRSNTGEGGEDPERLKDNRRSAIKQVASGRFGVTSNYLVNADEIQIKMAQGAKPGEGGQLPGHKVYPWIAKVRHSTPGVGLISPPPHHDIYSIEDLAQLIFDLKSANPRARINVKLVSEVGVGTIAAGVAKAKADVILISGSDGGTGASPLTSLKHAGLPWELGLAEANQTLLRNGLRSRVVLEADGQMKTGRDVVIAALLGAEEFGFSTAPLVSLGCIMMRVCQLNTCPVGVATQNPELRAHFTGKPEHVVNFMHFIAREVREIMARLGFRTMNQMIGRTDFLQQREAVHAKAKTLDLSAILYQPAVVDQRDRYQTIFQDHKLEDRLDNRVLLGLCKGALETGRPITATLPIKNTDRAVGTILGSELTRKHGADGLPENTIHLKFLGSAGQSFGAFIPKGISLELEGDSNDYIGKGLSGGNLTVYPPAGSTFVPEENIIIGNVALYGATGGDAFFRGVAGERFAVRNSGAIAVVEGVGDHGCEYMTGGKVVVLGETGRNFAAGMSGGVAYVLDQVGDFGRYHCNTEMVELSTLSIQNDKDEADDLYALIQKHAVATGSQRAWNILSDWELMLPRFVKILPLDYKRMLEAIEAQQSAGLSGDEALLAAFENKLIS